MTARPDLPWNDPVGARDRFTENMQNDTKVAALAMWDMLDSSDNIFQWSSWFQDAYNDQAASGGHAVWDQVKRRIWDNMVGLGALPTGTFTSWDCEQFDFLVPFVSGGWMMSRYDTLSNVIQEEPNA